MGRRKNRRRNRHKLPAEEQAKLARLEAEEAARKARARMVPPPPPKEVIDPEPMEEDIVPNNAMEPGNGMRAIALGLLGAVILMIVFLFSLEFFS